MDNLNNCNIEIQQLKDQVQKLEEINHSLQVQNDHDKQELKRLQDQDQEVDKFIDSIMNMMGLKSKASTLEELKELIEKNRIQVQKLYLA